MWVKLPIRVPNYIKWIHPSWYVWDKPSRKKTLYLTFDDGPIPEVTEWVLDTLSRKHLKATFFCIGDNVNKHPELFKRILSEGHSVGNHTHNHLKGWETETSIYIENTELAEKAMKEIVEHPVKGLQFPLFRPPYGKIKRKQAKALKNKGYQLIMYRTVAYDWDVNVSKQKCLENVITNSKSGDLIVFHDSIKAFANLKYALPKAIDYFFEKGYRFEKL